MGNASNEIWPIQAKGKVERLDLFGDPDIEKTYHKSLEQGRVLESSLGDANYALANRKRAVNEQIANLMNLQKLAIDGQNTHHKRFFLYAADAVNFINKVKKYTTELNNLAQAVVGNIGKLQTIEQNMFRMVQANINALSNLIAEICNWGLPDIPAIPNLFSDTIWHFNGFNFFPLAAFLPHIGFDKNFTFGNCRIRVPNLDIFRNYPSTVTSLGDTTYGQPVFVPPLGGVIASDTTQYIVPDFIATMQGTTTSPVYTSTFNPNNLFGSLPDPTTIISNYHLDPPTYKANILSAVPALVNLVNIQASAVDERAAFIRFITLDEVVASNYDVNLTSVWLYYIDAARVGRAGDWIANFQQVYGQTVTPSMLYLNTTPIPWNNVLGGPGVTAGPQALPLIAALKADTSNNLKWRLSYIEASLLGYGRSHTWDAAKDTTYLDQYTADSLDYSPSIFDVSQTTPVIVGVGTAQFPVALTIPNALLTVMNEVIAQGALDIGFHPEFRTSRPQFRFTFDQFAQAKEVDRFTQYWREFNYNFQQLLLQDAYVVSFAVTYFDTLNSAINPLGNPTVYNQIKHDAQTRSKTWTPGTPLLPIPTVPEIVVPSGFQPDLTNNGWNGDVLNVTAFLARPDIQQLSIPTQIAMLRLNLSYAGLVKTSQDAQNEIQNQIAAAQAVADSAVQVGFAAEGAGGQVAPGTSLVLQFPTVDFDNTGNVTSKDTFTIQKAGDYAIAGTISFGAGDAGTRQVSITVNGVVVFESVATDASTSGPVDIPYTYGQTFNAGDIIQVQAFDSLSVSQPITAGDITCLLLPTGDSFATVPDNTDQGGAEVPKVFIAGVNVVPLQAVQIGSNGRVFLIDPTTNVLAGSPPLSVFPRIDGVTLGTATTGNPVDVCTVYGGVYQAPTDQGWTVGGLLYAGPGGTLTQDFPSILNTCYWVIVVGRATTSDTLIYEPNLPTSTLQGF